MALTLTFSTNVTPAAATAGSVTFTSAIVGDAHPDKLVIMGITVELATSVSAVTVNGVSATNVVQITGPTTTTVAAIFACRHASSTANIVVTLPGASTSIVAMSQWSLVGSERIRSSVASLGGSGATITLNPGPTIPSGGVGVYCFCNATDTTTVTWTRATERADLDAGPHRHSVADSSTAGSTTIVADGATAQQALVGASWGPQPEIGYPSLDYPAILLSKDKMVDY